jgi:hypothetical protein
LVYSITIFGRSPPIYSRTLTNPAKFPRDQASEFAKFSTIYGNL